MIQEYPGGKAVFIGSSILLQVADRFFFASAAHVFKAPPAGATLHVVGDSRNGKLCYEDAVGGTDASSANPAEGSIDVAFIEVSSHDVARLGGAAAVQMDQVDVDESLRPKGRYLAIGYPGSKTKVHHHAGTLNVNPLVLHTGRVDLQSYAALGLSPNTHLVFKYDRDSISWTDNVKRKGPRPHGMSGGGVWRVRNVDPAPPSPADAKLISIMIEYRAESDVIIATRIALLLEGIRFRFPELATHIPSTTAVKLNAKRG